MTRTKKILVIGIPVLIAIGEVFVREKHLCDAEREALKGLFVGPHEEALADGSSSLFERQAFRVFAQPEFFDAGYDRAG